LTHNCVKRSIFWELPYWKTNLPRHNLDIKKICLRIFSTRLWTSRERQRTTSMLE
jgi:hypothetical protein